MLCEVLRVKTENVHQEIGRKIQNADDLLARWQPGKPDRFDYFKELVASWEHHLAHQPDREFVRSDLDRLSETITTCRKRMDDANKLSVSIENAHHGLTDLIAKNFGFDQKIYVDIKGYLHGLDNNPHMQARNQSLESLRFLELFATIVQRAEGKIRSLRSLRNPETKQQFLSTLKEISQLNTRIAQELEDYGYSTFVATVDSVKFDNTLCMYEQQLTELQDAERFDPQKQSLKSKVEEEICRVRKQILCFEDCQRKLNELANLTYTSSQNNSYDENTPFVELRSAHWRLISSKLELCKQSISNVISLWHEYKLALEGFSDSISTDINASTTGLGTASAMWPNRTQQECPPPPHKPSRKRTLDQTDTPVAKALRFED